jgi:hypothetical protein
VVKEIPKKAGGGQLSSGSGADPSEHKVVFLVVMLLVVSLDDQSLVEGNL